MSLNEIFEIPENHTIVEISHRAKGGFAENEDWVYEERDHRGNLVSRIEEWDYVSRDLRSYSGYRKYAPSGKLIKEVTHSS